MDNPKMLLLIDRLVEKTERGELHWIRGAARGSYQASFPTSSVAIGPPSALETIGSNEPSPMVKLRVIDASGEQIASITDSMLSRLGEEIRSQKLRHLMSLAAFHAARGNETLDKILEALA